MDVTIFQTRMRNLLAGLLVLVSMLPAYGGETMENETTDECAGSVQRSPEASRLLNYLQGIYPVKDMHEAVEEAYKLTTPSKSCLLSPAAASYNSYKNFEERGEDFKNLVNKL